MKNFKISKKFIATFGMILVLFLVASVVAVGGIRTIRSEFNNFYEESFQVTNSVLEMQKNIESAAKFVGYATMSPEVKETQTFIDQSQASLDALEEGLAVLNEKFKQGANLNQEFLEIMNTSTVYKDEVFKNAIELNNEEAIKVFFVSYRPILVSAINKLSEISEAVHTQANDTFEKAKVISDISFFILIILVIVTFLLTAYLGIYMAKSLTRPIEELESAAIRMSNGDFDVDLTYVSEDELGSLSNSMRRMIEVTKSIILDTSRGLKEVAKGNFDIAPNVEYIGIFKEIETSIKTIIVQLSETMSQIHSVSEEVASGSNQLSESSLSLADGATEQSSAVEELVATINEVTLQVKLEAESAGNTSKDSQETGAQVLRCNEQMQSLVEAMQEIEQASNEISNIIKKIEDIATQTNLLSLNAAIEAARAGDAGKGFAVVAEEVRNLAGESADAAKDTALLIEKAISAVEKGTSIVDETANSLLIVVEKAGNVNQSVETLAAESATQVHLLEEIGQAVDQIANVVEHNSATAEESAASSQELSAQAQQLENLVAKFNLIKNIR